ncbi:MAG: NAD(P)/FAD-dependent oxidoreductase [Puniceicoccales bacterium]|jgi:phytoene dehydrogenase-like protein|nr:NAD(P)/FAD-dependent oxidoreductase [Puniceicoccales bacterium]
MNPSNPAGENAAAGGTVAVRDVIVVGAGIGGLATAVLLARKGWRPLVLEAHDKAGGLASSWTRRIRTTGGGTTGGDFIFSTGVQDISGLSGHCALAVLLENSPFKNDLRWLPTRQRHITDDLVFDVPDGWDALVEKLAATFPADAAGIRALFAELNTLLDALRLDTCRLLEGGGNAGAGAGAAGSVAGGTAVPHETYLAFLRRHVADPRFEALLTNICRYVTDAPETLPLRRALPLFGYYHDRAFYPAGGVRQLADTLAREITALGGEVRFRSPVVKIFSPAPPAAGTAGAATVLLADGSRLAARAVVADTNAETLFRELLAAPPPAPPEPPPLPPVFRARLAARAPGPSALLLNAALDFVPDLPEHTFVTTGDFHCALANPSRNDPALAPRGAAVFSVLTLVSAADAARWLALTGDAYRDAKRDAARRLLAAAARALPDISRHILHSETATPRTFARFARTLRGMIYGHAATEWAPQSETPFPWLFLAGADTGPGAGVEAAAVSGFNAARHAAEFLAS